MTATRRFLIVIGLLIAFGLPELGLTPLFQKQFGTLAGRELPWWILIAIMLVYVLAIERRPLSSIGLTMPTWKSAAWGVAFGVLLVVGIGVIYGVVFPVFGLHVNQKAALALIQTPFAYRVAMVTRAAVAEEIVYRGYPIERIGAFTGSTMIAAAIAWAAFTYAHLGYWGWAQLVVAGYGGVVLVGMYLWRRDLASNMIAHFIGDAIPFLLVPALGGH